MDIEALVAELPDELVDYIGDLHTQVDDLSKRLETAETTPPAPEDEPTDPIEKALSEAPAEFVELWKADRERLVELEAATKAAAIAKADEEWISKARSVDGFAKAEDLGPILRDVAERDPERAETLLKALTAASEQIKASDNLTKELGSAGVGFTAPEEQIATIAKSYREADPSMDDAAARAKAWEDNPELYEQYVNERR